MDRTIRGLVNDYLERHDLKSKGEATDLERFGNYCVFYPYQAYDKFNINNVHVGGLKDDSGIDRMGIIVHGGLLDVENEDELDEKVKRENKRSRIILTQHQKLKLLSFEYREKVKKTSPLYLSYYLNKSQNQQAINQITT